jgi:hypothetical protein
MPATAETQTLNDIFKIRLSPTSPRASYKSSKVSNCSFCCFIINTETRLILKNQDFDSSLFLYDAHLFATYTPERLCQILKSALGKATAALKN